MENPKKEFYLTSIIHSHYCKVLFFIIFILSYYLMPIKELNGFSLVLRIIFIALFSLSFTCIIRNIKEKIKLQRTYKSSIVSLLASAIGLSALQVCGFGGPVCGASLGLSILTAILPNFVFKFLMDHSIIILIIAILFQFMALYFLKCFKKVNIKSCKPL